MPRADSRGPEIRPGTCCLRESPSLDPPLPREISAIANRESTARGEWSSIGGSIAGVLLRTLTRYPAVCVFMYMHVSFFACVGWWLCVMIHFPRGDIAAFANGESRVSGYSARRVATRTRRRPVTDWSGPPRDRTPPPALSFSLSLSLTPRKGVRGGASRGRPSCTERCRSGSLHRKLSGCSYLSLAHSLVHQLAVHDTAICVVGGTVMQLPQVPRSGSEETKEGRR